MFNNLSLVDYNAIGSHFDNANSVLSELQSSSKEEYDKTIAIVAEALGELTGIEEDIQELLQNSNDLLLLNKSDSDNIVSIPLVADDIIENFRVNTANNSLFLAEKQIDTKLVTEVNIGATSNFTEDPSNKLSNMTDGNGVTYAGIEASDFETLSGNLIFRMPEVTSINGFYFTINTGSNDAFIINKVYTSLDGDQYTEVQSHNKIIINGKVKVSIDLVDAIFIKIDITYSGRDNNNKLYVKLYDVFAYNAIYHDTGYVTYKINLPDEVYNMSLYDMIADRIAPNSGNDIVVSVSADSNKWEDISSAPIHTNLAWDSTSLKIEDIAYIKIKLTNDLTKEDIDSEYRTLITETHPHDKKIKLTNEAIDSVSIYNETPISIGEDYIRLGKTDYDTYFYSFDVSFDLSNTRLTVYNIEIPYVEDEAYLSNTICAYHNTTTSKLYISIPNMEKAAPPSPDEWVSNDIFTYVPKPVDTELFDTLTKRRRTIKILFDEEIVPDSGDFTLDRTPFNNEESVTITAVEYEDEDKETIVESYREEKVPKGVDAIQLSYTPILDETHTIRCGVDCHWENFIDGSIEFLGKDGAFSYDPVTKILYLSRKWEIPISFEYYQKELYVIPHEDYHLSDKRVILKDMWNNKKFTYIVTYDWSHGVEVLVADIKNNNITLTDNQYAELQILKVTNDDNLISSYYKQFIEDSDIAALFSHRTPEVFSATVGIINKLI